MSTIVRGAIYTRKSGEEGLEQGFNTLDARGLYRLCRRPEARRMEADEGPLGDGGFSGGNTDPPALQRLLVEGDGGRISMIVVYKIERLPRSLADLARLVERLEIKGCSFVSVTQGLQHVDLHGPADAERAAQLCPDRCEVAGERIGDKIAASKKRGLRMGGTLPLGYDRHPDPREQVLVVADVEAATVRQIFNLDEETGSALALTEEVTRRDLRSKPRQDREGREIGNRPFGRGQLHYLLTNPVCRRRTRHGGTDNDGRHRPSSRTINGTGCSRDCSSKRAEEGVMGVPRLTAQFSPAS